jgi:hypothetical protein
MFSRGKERLLFHVRGSALARFYPIDFFLAAIDGARQSVASHVASLGSIARVDSALCLPRVRISQGIRTLVL